MLKWIGGLSVATFITLLLVPLIYAIFVLDLKLVKWEKTNESRDKVSIIATQPAKRAEA